MSRNPLYRDIIEWSHAESDDLGGLALDRESPDTLKGIAHALATPSAIEQVERLEVLAKHLWADVLRSGGTSGGYDATMCGDFFSELGFLFKYKPYGVKIATPFGYSLFDLGDGQGFSFQLHTEPKLEGFHILRVKQRALAYISTRQEWNDAGDMWARRGFWAAAEMPPFVWLPREGDVIEIAETEVVHSVLGCVLEEYASCSVDAVERLFDQNKRLELSLPARHPEPGAIYRSSLAGMPRRRVDRVGSGWAFRDWSNDDAVIDVRGELWGSRVQLSPDGDRTLASEDDFLTVIVAVDGPVQVRIDGHSHLVPLGGLRCVMPGFDARVGSTGSAHSVAVHRVSRRLVETEWTR